MVLILEPPLPITRLIAFAGTITFFDLKFMYDFLTTSFHPSSLLLPRFGLDITEGVLRLFGKLEGFRWFDVTTVVPLSAFLLLFPDRVLDT